MSDSAPSSRSRTRQVLASESRLRLLAILTDAGRGMHAGELAVECGLHVSTVRFHLDELRGAGLVRAHTEKPAGRGRPRQLFVPVSSAMAGWVPSADPQVFSGYERLARALAASVTAGDDLPKAMGRAQTAGKQWADELLSAPHPDEDSRNRVSAEPAHSVAISVNGLFAGLGFDPELRVRPGRAELLLHACPFDAVVSEHPAVACALHLGMLEGAVDRLGPGNVSAALEGPFAERPCIVRMSSPASPPAQNPVR